MAAKKKAARKKTAAPRGKGKKKVEKVMHEYKHGDLTSGSGRKVKSRKQAIAIALSEARAAGAHIAKKKTAGKTAVRKKPARKKAAKKKR